MQSLRTRIVRLLQRRGHWPRGDGPAPQEPDSLLPFLAAASIQGRVPLGPDAGKRVERLGQPSDAPLSEPPELCAAVDGFSLHARIRVDAHERERLEHLCRYIARPAIATERLSLSPQGKVILELRRPWRDGTTHFVFDPLTFISRLAALIPGRREHQLTYHGVLAPGSSWRDLIVPAPTRDEDHFTGVPDEVPASSTPAPASTDPSTTGAPEPRSMRPPHRYRWAELMLRVFSIDVLHCPHCGARRKLIALITDLLVARRILRHLGLESEAPAIAAARPPPQAWLGF